MPRLPLPPKTRLGAAIRTAREGKTAQEVAESIGLTQSLLSRLEQGKNQPTTETALILARWLGWTMEQVVEAAKTPIEEGATGGGDVAQVGD